MLALGGYKPDCESEVCKADRLVLVVSSRRLGVRFEMRCIAVIASATLSRDSGYRCLVPRFVLANGVKNEQASFAHTHKILVR